MTNCFPGTKVPDIVVLIPGLLPQLSYIQNVIIHTGCNYIPNQRSETFKYDFSSLLGFLKDFGKRIFISSPIAPFKRGTFHFNSILSLQTWFQFA